MGLGATNQTKQQTSHVVFKKVCKLAIGGGLAFWVVTVVFSLLPIAAEFRAALLMSHVEVFVGALLGGMAIGCYVSYLLFRWFDKMPTKNSILKSVILSSVALLMALGLLGVAASRVEDDGLHYFLVGAVLNVPRFFALGIVIGYLYKRLYRSEVATK